MLGALGQLSFTFKQRVIFWAQAQASQGLEGAIGM